MCVCVGERRLARLREKPECLVRPCSCRPLEWWLQPFVMLPPNPFSTQEVKIKMTLTKVFDSSETVTKLHHGCISVLRWRCVHSPYPTYRQQHTHTTSDNMIYLPCSRCGTYQVYRVYAHSTKRWVTQKNDMATSLLCVQQSIRMSVIPTFAFVELDSHELRYLRYLNPWTIDFHLDR